MIEDRRLTLNRAAPFTMPTAPNTLIRLAAKIFSQPEDREAFIESVLSPRPYEPALVWMGDRPEPSPFAPSERLSWQPDYVDRVSIDQRPGQHALHEAGCYYCLDISSVFTSCVLGGVVDSPSLVVDLCASPGGKAIQAWRRFQPPQLICNEVIRKRTGALISNLRRCRVRPTMVISRDTSYLAEALRETAELVIVDAPCSGQSLVARGKPSPGCFHPATINMNANRQRRILANSARLVAPGGYLAYITCTYSPKENEGNLKWFVKRFAHFAPRSVPLLQEFQSHLSESPCYRLWPHGGAGVGGFAVLLQNTDEGEAEAFDAASVSPVWTNP